MSRYLILSLLSLSLGAAQLRAFDGAGGFGVALYQPELGAINNSLRTLGMPEFQRTLIIYGGQGFGYVSQRFAIGGAGFVGRVTVSDMENGYARMARFSIRGGGLTLEYLLLELERVDFVAGGLIGWGGAELHLQKTHSPIDWNDVWDNYQALSDTVENISSDLTHSFFLFQPRLGMRVYLTTWLAISGSIEVPLSKLGSGGWRLNDAKVYNAPDVNLIAPYYHFSILFGG